LSTTRFIELVKQAIWLSPIMVVLKKKNYVDLYWLLEVEHRDKERINKTIALKAYPFFSKACPSPYA
jgi:hypothetical protein